MISGKVVDPPGDIRELPIGNARLGVLLFIAAETMLFGGLIAAYVVLRFSSDGFQGMTRPPLGAAAVRSALLVLSSLLLLATGREPANRWLFLGSFLLGASFLGLAVAEWAQLLSDHVLPFASIFGGMFHILSWAHALHLVPGLVVLLALASGRRWFGGAVFLYWHFVTVLWVLLGVLLYLL